jgi:hypothetical protein
VESGPKFQPEEIDGAVKALAPDPPDLTALEHDEKQL